jgi:hypothetical protein
VTHVVINPGSGPVPGATYENAVANMFAFAGEVGAESWSGGADTEDGGRWTFELRRGADVAEVEMPGLPLERVRYVGADDQNIWDFPRLYVNGSSWVWAYALGVVWPDREDCQ